MSKIHQYELNQKIEDFIRSKDAKRETYSQKDIDFILQHEGKGGQGSKGATGEGLLYEYFTPEFLANELYDVALHYGYDGGAILEPSIGTGRMIKPYPDKSKITAFEVNPLLARIVKIAYPQVKLYTDYFETAFLQSPRYTSRIKGKTPTWLKDYPFSLVVGNPPYGIHKNLYSGYFKTQKFKQLEQFFMYWGLQLLKPNGVLLYVTSSSYHRNGETYTDAKNLIYSIGKLVDSYRLPPVFKTSDVPIDVLVFKKK